MSGCHHNSGIGQISRDRFESMNVDAEVGTRVLDVSEEPLYVLGPGVCASDWLYGRMQLHIVGAVAQVAVDVSGVDRGDGSPHHLHVLIRHRLPPFLGEPFSGGTGLVYVEK
jgi:hypothetical protein